MERDSMGPNETKSTEAPAPMTSRRKFMLAFGAGLNVVAGVLLAVPLVGYVMSSLRHKDTQAWIPLGQLEEFPEKTTRLATFRNPFTVPWDGPTANIPCWVRRTEGEKFQVFAINC